MSSANRARPHLTALPASFTAMQETPLELAGCIGESSAYPAAGVG